MTIIQMQYFQAVCQYKNITQAANALHVTQPAVSIAIRELEAEFGVRLLFRQSKELLPTPEGLFLLGQIDSIMKICDITNRQMDVFAQKRPTLRLGLTPILSVFFFDRIFNPFRKAYPQVQLVVDEYPITNIYAYLRETSLDAVFTFLDSTKKYEAEFNVLPLFHSKLCFCVSEYHPMANLDKVTVSMLQDHPLVVTRAYPYLCKLLDDRFKEENISSNIVLQSSQFHVIRNYIMQNEAGAILTDVLVGNDPSIISIPINPPIEMPVGITWNKNKLFEKTAVQFATFVKNLLEQ